MASVVATAERALALCRQGRFAEAKALLEPLTKVARPDKRVLALLGAVCLELGDRAAGSGDVARALALYARSIAVRPDHFQAHYNRGVVLYRSGDAAAAIASYRRAIVLEPKLAAAHSALGVVQSEAGADEDALRSHAQAIALAPDSPEFHNNHGLALERSHRRVEAIRSFDAALALAPDFAAAWCNRGVALHGLGRRAEALESADRALAIDPRDAEAWSNRGLALHDLQRNDEALLAFATATELAPGLANAWASFGAALNAVQRHEEALAAYDRALTLEPSLSEARGDRLHTAMLLCDWSTLAAEVEALCAAIVSGAAVVPPFALLATTASAAVQKRCAELYVAAHWPQVTTAAGPAHGALTERAHGRIRVGYFSADFREHATMHLMAELFERHDRDAFELHAFSFGPTAPDPMRARAIATFEHFHDVGELGDERVAELGREHGIDIAVDLAGFTRGARPGIFAARAAPVQVSYLGFPATLAAPFIDYVIADPIVLPSELEDEFTEAVARLPGCYQANAAWQPLGTPTIDRRAAGLPEEGFVFCSFNNTFKITPDAFDVWMRLLQAIPGSVLWLIEGNAAAVANLRREAARRGVDDGRIVFAPRMRRDEHLRRHALADLFLDTFHYGAHTTASDALRAGLPVLTRRGDTFAARVAASLCHAAGMDELVTTSTPSYESTALVLASDPARLAAVRPVLLAALPSAPLFDARRFARDIERLYAAMHERRLAGLPPARLGPLDSRAPPA